MVLGIVCMVMWVAFFGMHCCCWLMACIISLHHNRYELGSCPSIQKPKERITHSHMHMYLADQPAYIRWSRYLDLVEQEFVDSEWDGSSWTRYFSCNLTDWYLIFALLTRAVLVSIPMQLARCIDNKCAQKCTMTAKIWRFRCALLSQFRVSSQYGARYLTHRLPWPRHIHILITVHVHANHISYMECWQNTRWSSKQY